MSEVVAEKESYSPGLEGVIAGETAISTLAAGLEYRGYNIEDLTAHSTFEETAYLILYGELPNASQAAAFQQRIKQEMVLPPEITNTLRLIPAHVHPMDVMRTGASLIAHWDPETADMSPAANLRKAERILAKMPVVLGTRTRLLAGREPVAADPQLSFAANVLRLMSGASPSEQAAHAMDISLILYAEHEFNASTFAARCICSTLSDLHSAIVGAIGTLKGPLHGGANEKALEVLLSVGGSDKAEAWIRSALARKERIMGFGHRVYKTGDPRAAALKKFTQVLATEAKHADLEKTADIIEAIVVREKKLPANVDWPCARLYHYLGIDVHNFTPLFVVARVTGWSAHIMEQLNNNRLMRPRGLYVGPALRKWQPPSAR
jgi:2-methylcitrate synthase/citrate synthase II